MGDLEQGLTYFELEKVKKVNEKSQQMDEKQQLIRNFYLALGGQLLIVYFICDLIHNNQGLKSITYDNPIFYIATYFILFSLFILLGNLEIKSSQFIPFFLIFTIIQACAISLFIQYSPSTGFYSLYFTILVTFCLYISSNFTDLQEQGYSIVASVQILILIISMIANKNNSILVYQIATLISLPFCLYSVNKILNLKDQDKNEGFLVLSVKIYLYFLISSLKCIYETLMGCCSGCNNCCQGSNNCYIDSTSYDYNHHSSLINGDLNNNTQCDCNCDCDCNCGDCNCDINC